MRKGPESMKPMAYLYAAVPSELPSFLNVDFGRDKPWKIGPLIVLNGRPSTQKEMTIDKCDHFVKTRA
jgi:hypothetical protein